MKLLVLHGPNLDLLGERPGDVPGLTLVSVEAAVRDEAARVGFDDVRCLQSNHEGALVDALREARGWATAVLLNPGALTHASYVLHDALAATRAPVVEVHLSNLDDAREPWRKQTVLADVVRARIHGEGVAGYVEAVRLLAGESVAASKNVPGGASWGATPPGTQGAPDVEGKARVPSAATEMGAQGGAVTAPSANAQSAGNSPGTPTMSVTTSAPGAQGGEIMAAPGGRGATATVPASSAPSAPASTGSSFAWNVSNIPPVSGGDVGAPVAAPMPVTPSPAAPRKTLGRRRPETRTASPRGGAWPSGVPTREALASRIARHLSGSESAASLAAFAREGWMHLDAGAEVPPSERPLLEDALRRLMFLDRKAGALDAQALVELLARLQ